MFAFRHPAALTVSDNKVKSKNKKTSNEKDVNGIIEKILKQQTHLRAHFKRLETIETAGEIEPVRELGERHQKGKGYILKTFLKDVVENSEEIYSHDSGIGSALPTSFDIIITNKEEVEFRSFDTIFDSQLNYEEVKGVESYCQLEDLIIEYERIANINEKLQESENQIKSIIDTIDDVEADISEKEIKDLNMKSKITNLQEEIEKTTRVSSKMNNEKKKNDISISHMMKNYDGRKAFLNTLEIDINRAESYGKRLQIEFEKEYETFNLCQDILSACEAEETKVESKQIGKNSDTSIKPEVSEKDDLEVHIDKNSLMSSEFVNTNFIISATQNPFGL